MNKPKSYLDVADQARRDQLPKNANEQRWEAYHAEEQAEQRAADAARALLAEKLRQWRYVRVEPLPQEVAQIEERHRMLGSTPDWMAYRRAAAERAERAVRRQYADIEESLKEQVRQAPD